MIKNIVNINYLESTFINAADLTVDSVLMKNFKVLMSLWNWEILMLQVIEMLDYL